MHVEADGRRDGGHRALKIVGLAGQQHGIHGRRCLDDCFHGKGQVTQRALDDEPGLGELCGASRPDQETHVHAGRGQTPAEIAPDPTCTQHQKTHGHAPV